MPGFQGAATQQHVEDIISYNQTDFTNAPLKQSFSSDTSNFGIIMPSGLLAGQLIIVFIATDDVTYVVPPDEWLSICFAQGDPGSVSLHVFVKVCAGSTESSTTVNFSCDSPQNAVSQIYLARPWSGFLSSVQGAAQSSTTGGALRYFPTITPEFGNQKAGWLIAVAISGNNSVSNPPDPFSFDDFNRTSTLTSGAYLWTAQQDAIVSSTYTPNPAPLASSTTASIATAVVYVLGPVS